VIEELAKNPYYGGNLNKQTRVHIKKTVNYFAGKLHGKVLDIGQQSPLTEALMEAYGYAVTIDNTEGDLDLPGFKIPGKRYDVIIYSHTLEHQFNHLMPLLRLKDVLAPNGALYLLLPDRGRLLWCRGHYHEIDEYRVNLLMKRAGLKIISKTRHKVWRDWYHYLKGFRPILRFFFEYHVIYEIRMQ